MEKFNGRELSNRELSKVVGGGGSLLYECGKWIGRTIRGFLGKNNQKI